MSEVTPGLLLPVPPSMIIALRTLGGVYSAIQWATEHRREWKVMTTPSGWEMEITAPHPDEDTRSIIESLDRRV